MTARRTRLTSLRMAVALLVLTFGLLAGCGDDGGDGDSGGGGGDGDGRSSEVDAAVDRCKDAVQEQVDSGAAPEAAQDELDAICESVEDASPEEARRVSVETCVVVTVETSGGAVDEQTAQQQCERAFPE